MSQNSRRSRVKCSERGDESCFRISPQPRVLCDGSRKWIQASCIFLAGIAENIT